MWCKNVILANIMKLKYDQIIQNQFVRRESENILRLKTQKHGKNRFLFCYRTILLDFTSADDASKRGRQKDFDMMMPEFPNMG